MMPGYTRKLGLFPVQHTGITPEGLTVTIYGRERPLWCPLCRERIKRWLNWYEAKEYDDDLWAECAKGHTIPDDYMVVKLVAGDIEKIMQETKGGNDADGTQGTA